MALFSKQLIRLRVSNVLSEYVNNGPFLIGCWLMYVRRFSTGHTSAPEGERHIVHPWRNGSVLEVLIRIWMLGCWYDTSSKHRVVSGSNLCV